MSSHVMTIFAFVKYNLWPQLLLFCLQLPIWFCLSLTWMQRRKEQLVSCHCCSHADHSLRMTLFKCFWLEIIPSVCPSLHIFCVRPMQQGLLVLNNRIFLLLLCKAWHADGLASPTPELITDCFSVKWFGSSWKWSHWIDTGSELHYCEDSVCSLTKLSRSVSVLW